MATISEIREGGTTLQILSKGLYEPLNAPASLKKHLERFGEHYDVGHSSNLYRFLVSVCGDAGAGSLKREMLYPKLQQMLDSTMFNDLDRLYGTPLGLPRISPEIYTVDPRNEALTVDQWKEVRRKDSLYRARCLAWMRAIIAGPTPAGMALAAEAATGIECDVFERYKYLADQNTENSLGVTNLGVTNARGEFVIIPRTTVLTQTQKRRITKLLDRLRPVNSIATVTIADPVRTARIARVAGASSEGFTVKRMVTGRTDIPWPAPDPKQGLWIETIEKEAPTFAWMDKQEVVTYLTVVGAVASSEHIGGFNKTHRELFPHLETADPVTVHLSTLSFARNFAPITITIPWTAR